MHGCAGAQLCLTAHPCHLASRRFASSPPRVHTRGNRQPATTAADRRPRRTGHTAARRPIFPRAERSGLMDPADGAEREHRRLCVVRRGFDGTNIFSRSIAPTRSSPSHPLAGSTPAPHTPSRLALSALGATQQPCTAVVHMLRVSMDADAAARSRGVQLLHLLHQYGIGSYAELCAFWRHLCSTAAGACSSAARLAMRHLQPRKPPTFDMAISIAAVPYMYRNPPLRRARLLRGSLSASCQWSASNPISTRLVRNSGRRAAASSSAGSVRHASCHAFATLATATNSGGPSSACCSMTATRSEVFVESPRTCCGSTKQTQGGGEGEGGPPPFHPTLCLIILLFYPTL